MVSIGGVGSDAQLFKDIELDHINNRLRWFQAEQQDNSNRKYTFKAKYCEL